MDRQNHAVLFFKGNFGEIFFAIIGIYRDQLPFRLVISADELKAIIFKKYRHLRSKGRLPRRAPSAD